MESIFCGRSKTSFRYVNFEIYLIRGSRDDMQVGGLYEPGLERREPGR